MKVFKSRWAVLILGLLVGCYGGADLAIRFMKSEAMKYDRRLEDKYVDWQLWTLATSKATIEWAEESKMDDIIRSHETMMRGAFHELVALHKTPHYDWRNADMEKWLFRARDFVAGRPEGFLDKEFYSMSTIIDRANNGGSMALDPESEENTRQARDFLQADFDYVDGLSRSSAESSKKPKSESSE